MGALRVGRITDQRVITSVNRINLTATTVELEGRIMADPSRPVDLNWARAVRDQLVGLGSNPDEPVVPLIVDRDITLTEMVEITGVAVPMQRGDGDLDPSTGGKFPFRITANRCGALPNVESTLIGGHRATALGGLGVGAVNPWHAVPAAAYDYYDGASVFTSGAIVRVTDTGVVALYYLPTGLSRRVARFCLLPANWYDGASLIELKYGSDYRTLIGRHLYLGISALGWRLNNGLIRISPATTAGELAVEYYDGAAWQGPTNFKLTAYDGVTNYVVNRINTVAIRRNSPEECKVRLTVGLNSGGLDYPIRSTLDLSLRRGDRVADCRWSIAGTTNMLGKVQADPGRAGTAVVNGAIVDAGLTPRIFIASPIGVVDAGNTGWDSTATPSLAWSFGIGWQLNTGTAETAAELRDQYFGALAERMTVVGW